MSSTETRKRPQNGGTSPVKKRKQLVYPKSTNPVNSEGVSECFQVFSTRMYVSLAPCFNNNPINGIKTQHLDPLVMSYFHKAEGVVLAYSNIKLSDDNSSTDSQDKPVKIAKISASSPFTYLWITVDLLVWRPQLGDVVEGYCYMQTASHIGLLVHDTFNASIRKFNIPQSWQFVPNQADELSEDTGKFRSFGYWLDENENKVDGKLQFTIKAIHSSGKMVSVEGTLIKPGTEQDSQPIYERRDSASHSQTPVNKHKKFDDDDMPTVTEIAEPKDENDLEKIPHYSKSSGEESDDAIINQSDSNESSD